MSETPSHDDQFADLFGKLPPPPRAASGARRARMMLPQSRRPSTPPYPRLPLGLLRRP